MLDLAVLRSERSSGGGEGKNKRPRKFGKAEDSSRTSPTSELVSSMYNKEAQETDVLAKLVHRRNDAGDIK